ncbi:MAG: hypothetical protein QF541_14525 [Lentisphaeria bacterium]|jgi:hypothetical protein|nr:hypothetical protein [Lentisphaeria bacterium]
MFFEFFGRSCTFPQTPQGQVVKFLFVPAFKAEGDSTENNWKEYPLNKPITESAAGGGGLGAQIIKELS